MGTIKIGSSKDKKGVTINPSTVLFNGKNVKKIMSGLTEIWVPKMIWFSKGKLFNTNLFGTPIFVTQNNGVVNSSTYGNDGYIYLGYGTNSGGTDALVYTNNRITRGVYSKAVVSFVLSENSPYDQHKFRFGFRGSHTNQSDIANASYYTNTFNVSNALQTQELDLTQYNASGTDLYFFVGGGGNKAKIYNIEFVLK